MVPAVRKWQSVLDTGDMSVLFFQFSMLAISVKLCVYFSVFARYTSYFVLITLSSSVLTHFTHTQTCSRVLLDESQRRVWLQRVRRPNIENPQRVAFSRAVTVLCKRYVYCPFCDATNGVVKKVGSLKIVHERFRSKKTSVNRTIWERGFDTAISEQKEIRPHLHKAQDDMNPLRVLNLFKAIPSEV